MLILTRKLGESIIIGDNIKIKVVEINNQQIRLGVDAPKDIIVHREEVYNKIKEENKLSSTSDAVEVYDFAKKRINATGNLQDQNSCK